MLDESTEHLREIIDDASNLMTVYFKKCVTFSKVIQLSEPDRRNVLLRLLIEKPQEGIPRTIILKQNATVLTSTASHPRHIMEIFVLKT